MKDKNRAFDETFAEHDDVEILEVVGVDKDAPAPDATEEDADEIVLAFDDEDDRGGDEAEAGEAVPAESPAAPAPACDTEQVQRLRADYDNLVKRVERERTEFEERASARVIERLLPILDDFDRALSAPGGDGFREGMGMVYQQMVDALEEQGLAAIRAVGEPFDPNVHDAVATDTGAEVPDNTVVEEMRRGYLFRQRVLRHALVKVRTGRGELPDE